MTKKATDAEFNELHGEIAKQLTKRIKDGTATAADIAVAVKFLKDNGITATPVPKSPLGNLADELPTFEDGDLPMH